MLNDMTSIMIANLLILLKTKSTETANMKIKSLLLTNITNPLTPTVLGTQKLY